MHTDYAICQPNAEDAPFHSDYSIGGVHFQGLLKQLLWTRE